MEKARDRIVFAVKKYLNQSETFIYEPLKKISSFEVIVLAEEKANLDQFPHPHVFSISDLPPRQRFWENISSQLGHFKYFKEIIEKHKPRLIHAHFGWEGPYMLPLKRHFNLPLVTSFYGSDINVYSKNPVGLWHLKRLFSEGDLFLAASRSLKEKAVSLGCPEYKTIVQYCGIDINKFKPVFPKISDKITILMCGRLVEHKGFIEGIKAFAQCFNKHRNIRMELIGNGPLKNKMSKLIEKLDLREVVSLPGSRPHQEVAKALLAADIFMMPYMIGKNGECEAAPSVLKEAQAAALPVLSTYHGGVPEVIIDGKTGFLVKEQDFPALVQKLNALIENPRLRAEFGENGRRIIEKKFTLAFQVRELENIYRRLVDDYRKRA